MLQLDGLGRALAGADAAATAGSGGNLGCPQDVTRTGQLRIDDRHVVRADPHTGQAAGAFLRLDDGHHAADLQLVLREDGRRAGCGRLGLGDGLVQEFGILNRAAQVGSLGGEIHRLELEMRLQHKAFQRAGELHHICQVTGAFGRHHGRREHQRVRLKGQRYVQRRVGDDHAHAPVFVRHLWFVGLVEADECDALLSRLGVELLAEAVGADVLEQHVDPHVGVEFLELEGVLHRRGTADAAAVEFRRVAVCRGLVPRADALDHHHLFQGRRVQGAVGNASLQIALGHDLRVRPQAVGRAGVFLRAGGHDGHAVLDEPLARPLCLLHRRLKIAHVAFVLHHFVGG